MLVKDDTDLGHRIRPGCSPSRGHQGHPRSLELHSEPRDQERLRRLQSHDLHPRRGPRRLQRQRCQCRRHLPRRRLHAVAGGPAVPILRRGNASRSCVDPRGRCIATPRPVQFCCARKSRKTSSPPPSRPRTATTTCGRSRDSSMDPSCRIFSRAGSRGPGASATASRRIAALRGRRARCGQGQAVSLQPEDGGGVRLVDPDLDDRTNDIDYFAARGQLLLNLPMGQTETEWLLNVHGGQNRSRAYQYQHRGVSRSRLKADQYRRRDQRDTSTRTGGIPSRGTTTSTARRTSTSGESISGGPGCSAAATTTSSGA